MEIATGKVAFSNEMQRRTGSPCLQTILPDFTRPARKKDSENKDRENKARETNAQETNAHNA